MTHDEHLRRIADQLAERIGDYAALDLGALFDLLAQTAEELEAVTVLDDGLIAAARERHVDGKTGVLVALRERLAVAADTDGKRRNNALMVLKHRELFRRQLVQLGVLDDKDVLVAVIFSHDGARILDPRGQTPVDAGEDAGLLRVGRILDELLIVVDGDHRNGRPARLGIIAQMNKFRAVDEMEHHHLTCARLDHAAEHMVDAASHAQLAREGGLALDEPARLERRRELGQTHVRRMCEMAGHVREGLVRPDDLSGRRERDNGRQRRFRDRRADFSALDLDIFHQIIHPLPPLRVAADRDHAQNDDDGHADEAIRL